MPDFDFLAGEWKIHNRRLTAPGGEWEEFPGEATVWSALNGNASIEELRLSADKVIGMGVRTYHVATGEWADHWVGGAVGVVNEPMMGTFVDGVGTFLAEDVEDDGSRVLARRVGPHHADLLPLAPGDIERRWRHLGRQLVDGVDSGVAAQAWRPVSGRRRGRPRRSALRGCPAGSARHRRTHPRSTAGSASASGGPNRR